MLWREPASTSPTEHWLCAGHFPIGELVDCPNIQQGAGGGEVSHLGQTHLMTPSCSVLWCKLSTSWVLQRVMEKPGSIHTMERCSALHAMNHGKT